MKDTSKPPTPDNIVHLQFTRLAFGIVASSFILQATIHFHLEKKTKVYPELTQLEQDFYAGNMLTGAESVEQVIRMAAHNH